MVIVADNLTQSSGRQIWVPDQGVLVPPNSGVSSMLQSQPAVRALRVELRRHEPLLERLQMPAASLDEDTQVTNGLETSPGQQLWINTQGALEGKRGSCWRQAVIQTSC